MKRLVLLFWVGFIVVALGCRDVSLDNKTPDPLGASINGINYTNRSIYSFYVDGAWGGNVSAYGGGGSLMCCAKLPASWSPDLKLKVTWYYADSQEVKHERLVNVKKYVSDDVGDLRVAFLPNGDIEIYTCLCDFDSPRFPGSIRMWPDEYEERLAKMGEASNAR